MSDSSDFSDVGETGSELSSDDELDRPLAEFKTSTRWSRELNPQKIVKPKQCQLKSKPSKNLIEFVEKEMARTSEPEEKKKSEVSSRGQK